MSSEERERERERESERERGRERENKATRPIKTVGYRSIFALKVLTSSCVCEREGAEGRLTQ